MSRERPQPRAVKFSRASGCRESVRGDGASNGDQGYRTARRSASGWLALLRGFWTTPRIRSENFWRGRKAASGAAERPQQGLGSRCNYVGLTSPCGLTWRPATLYLMLEPPLRVAGQARRGCRALSLTLSERSWLVARPFLASLRDLRGHQRHLPAPDTSIHPPAQARDRPATPRENPREAHVPAQQPQTPQQARIPQPLGLARRQERDRRTATQGPQASVGLDPQEVDAICRRCRWPSKTSGSPRRPASSSGATSCESASVADAFTGVG